jgi:hypothetical protein
MPNPPDKTDEDRMRALPLAAAAQALVDALGDFVFDGEILSDDVWRCRDALRAALARDTVEVPREPTRVMRYAGADAAHKLATESTKVWADVDMATVVYRAMIDRALRSEKP